MFDMERWSEKACGDPIEVHTLVQWSVSNAVTLVVIVTVCLGDAMHH